MIIESDSIAATDSTQVEEDDVNLCSVIVAHNSEVDGDGNVELELKYDRKNERVSFLIVQVVIVHVATQAFSVTVGSRT